MLEALNEWLIGIIDIVLALWPSTPEPFKLSTMLGGLQADFPLAPWYLLGTFVTYFTWAIAAIVLVKVFKLVWP